MVMEDSAQPRDTFVLKRGAYDNHGEKVTPGVPAVLPPLQPEWPNNRLGLARWLVDRGNPLTARVTVNRFWQMYFGTGIVKTVEDFGSQGEWPVHPELLDWLAAEFMDSGWNVKAMQKTIVMSATYRQSSQGHAGTAAERSGKPAAGARSALAPGAGDDSRPGAGCLGTAGREARRTVGEAVSAAGPVAGTGGRRGLRAGQRRRALPPQPVHLLEADRGAAVHDQLRFAQPRDLHGARDAHQHAAAGARPDERCHVSWKPRASWPSG